MEHKQIIMMSKAVLKVGGGFFMLRTKVLLGSITERNPQILKSFFLVGRFLKSKDGVQTRK